MANGGFCVSCMLFGIGSDNIGLGILVSKPLKNFKKAVDELKAHNKKASRLDAVTGADVFLKVVSVNNRLFINKSTLLLPIVWQQIKKDWFLQLRLFCFVGCKFLLSEGTTIAPKPLKLSQQAILETLKFCCSLDLMLVTRTWSFI